MKPKLGFVGVGWIGRNRMQALHASGAGEVSAIFDTSTESAKVAAEIAPQAKNCASLAELLELELDAIVIATPNTEHPAQAIAALERGLAVFCQKPLSRTAQEAEDVLRAARRADRLLEIDLSYRNTLALKRIRELVVAGELGDIYAADLVFHNAYGPDKPWFYDARLAGGGCLLDLGVHLIDAGLWMLDFPQVSQVTTRLYAGGKRLTQAQETVEDHAVASIELVTGASLQIACSWNLSAGQDALIKFEFYGTRGAAALCNVNGSFYDFQAHRFQKTRRQELAQPPDAWGGRGIVNFARKLAQDRTYDVQAERLLRLAEVMDRAYGRRGTSEAGPRPSNPHRSRVGVLEPGAL